VLYAYERFGLLGRASAAGPMSSYALPRRPNINDIKAADAATTERPFEASAVLLKNDGGALPLKGSTLGSVAVIYGTSDACPFSLVRSSRGKDSPDLSTARQLF
jgi:hypothetical protein